MNRRDFIKFSSLITTGFMCGCAFNQDISNNQSLKNSRPNIILVLTDDQGYGELSCHGHPLLQTPNLDLLYSQSLRMTDFHVSPTCAPTRSALMTGRHEFKNGVTHTIHERERMTLKAVTLPQMLKQTGYTCGIFGKWHLGDEDSYQPENRGFDKVFIHGAGGIGQNFEGSCADVPPNQQKNRRYFDPVVKHNKTFVETEGYCTDVFFRTALHWIHEMQKEEKPFFAYISTNAPHSPFIAPEKYKKRFKEKGLSKSLQGFYGMIENIDENMGYLMEKLKQWNLDKDTLVIFMTDNGSTVEYIVRKTPEFRRFTYNADMKGHKNTPDEGGTRVPAFFCWKGKIPEGVDVDCLAAHLDIFPTLAELAGARLPEKQIEGRSLVPLLENPKAQGQDRYLFIHKGRWAKGSDPNKAKYNGCAVRNERFRFVNNTELYDLHADPSQMVNVIDLYPEVVKEMRDAYDKWWAETIPLMINENASYKGIAPFIQQYERQKRTTGIPIKSLPNI